MTNLQHRDGFTLIELLVVISIIALLIALVLPTLQLARLTSQLMTCRSNQRQVSLGLFIYMNEHGGRVPYETSGGTLHTGDPNYHHWHQRIAIMDDASTAWRRSGYIPVNTNQIGGGVWHCPLTAQIPAPPETGTSWLWNNFGMNSHLGWRLRAGGWDPIDGDVPNGTPPLPVQDLGGQFVLIGDATTWFKNPPRYRLGAWINANTGIDGMQSEPWPVSDGSGTLTDAPIGELYAHLKVVNVIKLDGSGHQIQGPWDVTRLTPIFDPWD